MAATPGSTCPAVAIWASCRFTAEAFAGALAREARLTVHDPVATASDLLDLLASAPTDLVVVDSGLEGAAAVIQELARRFPSLAILVVGAHHHGSEIYRWLVSGATGCIADDSTLADAVTAVDRALIGEFVCPPDMSGWVVRRLLRHEPGANDPDSVVDDRLTARELQVLALIAAGDSNKLIARKLGISTSTVKNHVHSILRKLDVSRRAEATVFLRSTGAPEGTPPPFA